MAFPLSALANRAPAGQARNRARVARVFPTSVADLKRPPMPVPLSEQTVYLRIPADAGYLSLLRTLVGGCAGREDFTLDQIDDLRMAVDEAAAQLLRQATGASMELAVIPSKDALEVRVSATTAPATVIDRGSFSWTILQALADELDVDDEHERAVITLRKQRLPDLRGESRA